MAPAPGHSAGLLGVIEAGDGVELFLSGTSSHCGNVVRETYITPISSSNSDGIELHGAVSTTAHLSPRPQSPTGVSGDTTTLRPHSSEEVIISLMILLHRQSSLAL